MRLRLVVCSGAWWVVALAATTSTTIAQDPGRPAATVETGVITGVVTDTSGAPLVGVKVQAVGRRKRWSGPYYDIPTGKVDTTDDRGRFRLYFLPPGRYTVAVLASPSPSPFVLPASPVTALPTGHLRTYAPGTTSLANAAMVAVSAETEQSVTISVTPARFTTINGQVTTSDGLPAANFEVWLQDRLATTEYFGVQRGFVTTTSASARTAKDGSFILSRVPNGMYTATVTNGPTRRDEAFEIAEVPIEVTDMPVANLAVRTARGATASGRLEWAGRGPAPWPRNVKTLGTIRATAVGVAADFASVNSEVQPDGTFRFTSLYGARRIEALSLPSDWAIESIRGPQGVIADQNLDVTPGADIRDLRIVVTDRIGTLATLVVDEENRPFDTGWLLLMPRDAPSLDALGWGFRVGHKNQSRSGFYTMDRVVPGSYRAVAIDVAPFHLTADTDLIERARAAAIPIEITEGETSLRLRLVRLQPDLYMQR
jgi:hypothetical protein